MAYQLSPQLSPYVADPPAPPTGGCTAMSIQSLARSIDPAWTFSDSMDVPPAGSAAGLETVRYADGDSEIVPVWTTPQGELVIRCPVSGTYFLFSKQVGLGRPTGLGFSSQDVSNAEAYLRGAMELFAVAQEILSAARMKNPGVPYECTGQAFDTIGLIKQASESACHAATLLGATCRAVPPPIAGDAEGTTTETGGIVCLDTGWMTEIGLRINDAAEKVAAARTLLVSTVGGGVLYLQPPREVLHPSVPRARFGFFGQGLGDSASDAALINNALQSAGLPPNQVQAGISAYTGLSGNAVNALLDMLNGGPANLTTLAPLVASGMLLIPGVGPIAAAAVGALLPLIQGIIQLILPPAPKCNWTVGSLCFSNARPYGPRESSTGAINPNWNTWDNFKKNGLFVDAAYPYYRSMIQCELDSIGDSPTDPVLQFLRAYYKAWQANSEYAINGYASADPIDLLTKVAEAWNAIHDSSSTYTFVQKGGAQKAVTGFVQPACQAQGALNDPNTLTYVAALINGDVTSNQGQPLTINTGPRAGSGGGGKIHGLLPPHFPGNGILQIQGSGSSSASSAAKTLVVGTAVVAGVAAASIGAYAYFTHATYSAVAKSLYSSTIGRGVAGTKRALRGGRGPR